MGNKNRNRVKKSISPFVKWGKWGGDGVKAFVYAIIFTIVGSDGTSCFAAWLWIVQRTAQNRRTHADGGCCRRNLDSGVWSDDRFGRFRISGGIHVLPADACGVVGPDL